jgi:hypothetical protein
VQLKAPLPTLGTNQPNYEATNSKQFSSCQMAKTVILSGIVDEIITDKGSVVAQGSPILRIISLGNMYLKLPENTLDQ